MQPRIYVYKITFVDQPYWYWGWHKEKKYDEYYMGSPKTNKKYWDMYEPIKEIVEVFDYSEEGELLAKSFEMSLIRPDLNNPLCLNAGCGGAFSSKSISDGLKEKWKEEEYRERVSQSLSKTLKEKWKEKEFREPLVERLVEYNKERWKDGSFRKKMIPFLDSGRHKGLEATLSPQSRAKRIESFQKIGHQQGEKNSQFGKMWITDGTKYGSKRINRGDPIPEGYRPGRVCK